MREPLSIAVPRESTLPTLAEEVGERREPPWRIGRYELTRPVGAGAYGSVFEAIDPRRPDPVALKVLANARPAAVLRFKREFRALAGIHHPSLVELYELSGEADLLHLTMRLVSGLDFLLWARGDAEPYAPLPSVDRLRHALGQLAEAVGVLHQHGVAHLDLKPTNVLVEEDGTPVVLDFGLVQMRGDEGLPWSGRPIGTPAYMAPEQVEGRPGPASDWFSIGVMLHEALFGVRPVDAPLADDGHDPELVELCRRLRDPDPETRAGLAEIAAVLGSSSPKMPAPPRPSFVGRAVELEELRQIWRASTDAGGFAILRGASGTGKTALVRRLLAEVSPVVVLRGPSYEWESLPYKGFDPLVDELAAYLRLLNEATRAEVIGDDGPAVASLFPGFAALLPAPKSEDDERRVAERRERSFKALRRVLERLAEHTGVILLLEDVQWAGVDSARLLANLLTPAPIPGVLVLATSRADNPTDFERELDVGLRAVASSLDDHAIHLAPLSTNEIARVVASAMGIDEDSVHARRVAPQCAGLPRLAVRLGRYYARSGNSPDSEVGDGTVDHAIDTLVRADLACLDETELAILRATAIAGGATPLATVLDVAGVTEGALRGVARLCRDQLISTHGDGSARKVAVYHARIADTVIEAVPADERRRLHEAYAAVLARAESPPLAALARHLLEVGERGRAVELLERAALRAERALAFDRAAIQWQRVVELEPTPRRRLRLAEALSTAGRGAEAAAAFVLLADEAPSNERPSLLHRALDGYLTALCVDEAIALLARTHSTLGVPPLPSTGRALISLIASYARLRISGVGPKPRSAPVPDDELLRCDALWTLGRTLSATLPIRGMDFTVRALRAAVEAGDAVRVGRVLTYIGGGLMMMEGRAGRGGIALLQHAEDLAESEDVDYLRAMVLGSRAGADMIRGLWRPVVNACNESLRMLEERCPGSAWEQSMFAGVALKALENLGDLTALRGAARRLGRDGDERGDAYAQLSARHYYALLALAADRPDLAESHMRWMVEEVERASRGNYTVQHCYQARIAVVCRLYAGEIDEAAATLRAHWPKMRRAGLLRIKFTRVDLLALRGAVLLGRRAPSRRDLAEAVRVGRQLDATTGRSDTAAHAALLRGGVAAVSGAPRAEVVQHLRTAAAEFDRAGMSLYAAMARRGLALARDDADALRYADLRLRRIGIANPERWSAIQGPGHWALTPTPSGR